MDGQVPVSPIFLFLNRQRLDDCYPRKWQIKFIFIPRRHDLICHQRREHLWIEPSSSSQGRRSRSTEESVCGVMRHDGKNLSLRWFKATLTLATQMEINKLESMHCLFALGCKKILLIHRVIEMRNLLDAVQTQIHSPRAHTMGIVDIPDESTQFGLWTTQPLDHSQPTHLSRWWWQAVAY